MWPLLALLAFWLTLWTIGGVMASRALWRETWGDRAFLAVWLCAWVVGETLATTVVAWQLFGREELLVTADRVEVRQRIGPFARVSHVPEALVDSVRATPVGDGGVDYRLEVFAGGTKITVDAPLTQTDAEYAASIVEGRVHPKRRWSDETPKRRWSDEPTTFGFGGESAPPASAAETQPAPWNYHLGHVRWTRRAGAALLGGVVVAVVAALVLHDRGRGRIGPPPQREAFSDPRAYAAAVTLYALKPGRTVITGTPVCDENTTWEQWTCRVKGPVRGGAYAGRELVYRCSARGEGIICGMENPPPLPVAAASTQ